ncbi:MAG: 4Fe-4S binding protein [bacterium]
MRVYRLRFLIQIISFFLLTYAAYLGINLKLGNFLPVFSCPYIGRFSGACYLMVLQRSQCGMEIPFYLYFSMYGLKFLKMFLGFFILVILLNKTWCGWICPFGTLQDWITWLRKKLSIRESQFSWRLRDKLKPIKYIFLVYLVIVPVLIGNAGLHGDFTLPFCQICPAKPLMPLFVGDFSKFAIDPTNPVTITMTVLSMVLTGSILIGMIFKDRFFCMFCPLLALISLFDNIGFIQLRKKVDACTGCGNCQRVCPVNIREVHLEKEKENVLTQDCMECFKCVEACPQDNALYVKFLKWKLFSSSRKYVGKLFGR